MSKFSGENRVNVSVPLGAMLSNCLDERTRIFANETFYRYMYPYIPYVTGTMADTIDIQPDGIHFGAIYANRNYYGDNFRWSHEKHPLAQAHWGDVAGALHGAEIAKEVETYIKSNKIKKRRKND